MLLGQSSGSRSQLLSGSSPKMAPTSAFSIPGIFSPAPLPVRSEYVTLPKAPPSASEPAEDIPEITVTGQRIPWYAWVAAGVAGFAVLDSLLGRR
jgi:hypothetical protein